MQAHVREQVTSVEGTLEIDVEIDRPQANSLAKCLSDPTASTVTLYVGKIIRVKFIISDEEVKNGGTQAQRKMGRGDIHHHSGYNP